MAANDESIKGDVQQRPGLSESPARGHLARGMPLPGAVIGGKYRIEALIGQGGMGAVYRATNLAIHKTVALKWLYPDFRSAPTAHGRFVREAQAAARIRHPSIVDVYDVGEHDGALFMVMELLEGESFDQLLARHAVPVAEALRLVIQAMRGVAAAHQQGVVHRDIKPDNIFVVRDPSHPSGLNVKVLDFGISKLAEDGHRNNVLTNTGMAVGTPAYMSLEQMNDTRSVDRRTDVYAFGVLLYQTITGSLPFTGDTYADLVLKVATATPTPPCELSKDVPAALSDVVMRAMARRREDRYDTLEQLIEALEPLSFHGVQLARLSDSWSSALPEVGGLSTPTPMPVAPLPVAPLPSPHTLHPGFGPTPAPAPAPRPTSGAAWSRLVDRATGMFQSAVRALPEPAPKHGSGSQRVPQGKIPAAQFHTLVPRAMTDARDAIAAFLSSVFTWAEQLGPDALQLGGVTIPDATDYDYYALVVAGLREAAPDRPLRTGTFLNCATPLELRLAQLPAGQRKVVVAISDYMELGPGVRAKMLEYRNKYGAMVVPLYAREIQSAHRNGKLRELFDERVASFHPNENLYAAMTRQNPAHMVGMHKEVQEIAAAVHEQASLIVIDGLPGIGKTALVDRVAYDLNREFVRVRCATPHAATPREVALRIAVELGALPPDALKAAAPELSLALHAIAERVRDLQPPAVLVLEDADSLIRPLEQPGAAGESAPYWCFWTGLHALLRDGLRVIVTCVRGAPLRQRRIEELENPIANAVFHRSVPHLDFAGTARLVCEPGLQMNVHYSSGALRLIYREAGGNVALTRRICADIVEQLQRDPDAHRLRRLTISERHTARSLRRLSGGAELIGDEVLAWLGTLEKRVLAMVARDRPRAPEALTRALPGEPADALLKALDNLQRIRLVEFDGRYQVTIPLLGRWLKARVAPERPPSAGLGDRHFRWALLGTGFTTALITAYIVLSGSRAVTLSHGARGCPFSIAYPSRVIPGEEFELLVRHTTCERPPSELVMTAANGTIPRVGGAFTATAPIPLRVGAGELRLSVDEGPDTTYGFTIAGDGLQRASLRLGTDWIGRMSSWSTAFLKLLLAIPAFLGVIVTFAADLKQHVAKLRGSLSRA